MNKNNSWEIQYQSWYKKGFFKADPTSKKKPHSILMPPPNLTGELHLGHAMQHAILDAVARFKRMQGFDVLLLPGVDHAGILFEGTLNKLLEKQGLSKEKLGREEWLKKAWQFKDEMYQSFHQTWSVMGISADWSREVFTLEPKVQKAVFTEFKTFWEQELLYKGAYIVQWCPKCGTAIEDIEMEYQEKKEKLYYVKYPVVILNEALQSEESRMNVRKQVVRSFANAQDDKKSNQYIVVATARPETIFADTAVAIYPKHPKFAKYLNKQVKNPLTNELIPVIEDKRVDKEFGTGALKITPGHDLLDYEIGKDNDLKILHAIDKKGRLTSLANDLTGMKIKEAREKLVEKLKVLNLLEKEEDYTHSVPVCERCKTVVEPLISEEWFVQMKPLAEKALKNLGKINFLPRSYKKIIADWLKEIHDWSISRSLWWGHRIPVWYCEKCNPHHKVGKEECMVISLKKPTSCQNCDCKDCKYNEKDWVQDEQVLDTWFSSGLWPMSTLGFPEETPELKKYFPWDFELSAPEIKYLWIARMIMLSLWFKDGIPFKNMFFHGMLRDLEGRKFSKSLGNGIDPLELISQWGIDAVRMALYTYAIPGRDGRLSKQTIDERCKNFRNFATKLKNIVRFILELKPEGSFRNPKTENEDDKEIIDKLNKITEEVTKDIDSFNFHLAVEKLYNFIWHDFADIYLEKSKKRRIEAQSCLEKILKQCLILLHPFMPFTTEELYQKLVLNGIEGSPNHKESIMLEKWPLS